MNMALSEPVLGQDYAIIDDFLSSKDHESLWQYFHKVEFHRFHETKVSRIFGFGGPEGARGPDLIFPKLDQSVAFDASAPPELTGLGRRIVESEPCNSLLALAEPWNRMSLQPYIYPVGANLTWHLDAGRSAAFIYYAHPSWDLEWGGELLVSGRATNEGDKRGLPNGLFAKFFSTFASGAVLDHGLAHCIFPKPNRLVILRGGTPHTIKKVESAAGSAFRASVAGFFSYNVDLEAGLPQVAQS